MTCLIHDDILRNRKEKRCLMSRSFGTFTHEILNYKPNQCTGYAKLLEMIESSSFSMIVKK